MSNATKCRNTKSVRQTSDSRFRQLLALADEGNEDAVGDLFREYGFKYGRDEA